MQTDIPVEANITRVSGEVCPFPSKTDARLDNTRGEIGRRRRAPPHA
ncbi:hypothetical protein [Dictyobacter formicarum]|nr:hypothetical protein [Dictyobacter formicarum]